MNAQPLSFTHLTSYDGLSQSSVLCITQDYRGFMWLGTDYGLNRYDGVSFKKYFHNAGDTLGLYDNYINCLLADSKKTLWIGTLNGLNKLNLETNVIEKVPVSTGEEGISSQNVRCLYEDAEGNIWVGTNNGLNLLKDRSKNTFIKFYADNANGIAGNSVQCIFQDDENAVWVGTKNGLTRIINRDNNFDFTTFRHAENDNRSLPADNISAINQDAAHNIWIGLGDAGVVILNKNTRDFSRVSLKHIRSAGVNRIVRTREDKFWMSTLGGLLVVDPITGEDTLYQHDGSQQNSLSDNSIYGMYQDVAGNAWIGTYYGGVNIGRPSQQIFTGWKSGLQKNNLNDAVVTDIAEDTNHDKLWVGTSHGGFNMIDRATGSVTIYNRDKNKKGTIGSDRIKTVYTDKNNNIWIGTTGGGLNLFNRQTGTFSYFIFDPSNPAASSSEVVAVLEDSQDRFWVGTLQGLRVYKRSGNSLSPDTSITIPGKLGTQYVSTIIEDSHQNIWVGGLANLQCLKKNEKVFVNQDWVLNFINCLYEDKKGNLWVGVSHSNLTVYNQQTKKISSIHMADEAPGNQVLSFIGEDNNNNLWMVTDVGLCKLSLADTSFRILGKEDGVTVGGLTRNSFYKSTSGEFFFGSQDGLMSFFPDKMQLDTTKAPLLFTSLRLLNDSADAGTDGKILTKDISVTNKIRLTQHEASFTINFALLSYIKSESNSYQYKLEGLDNDWHAAKYPSITYPYLPVGSYTLLVKAANAQGVWTDPVALQIEVVNSTWQSWWAYVIYGIFSILILFFINRYFFRRAVRNVKS